MNISNQDHYNNFKNHILSVINKGDIWKLPSLLDTFFKQASYSSRCYKASCIIDSIPERSLRLNFYSKNHIHNPDIKLENVEKTFKNILSNPEVSLKSKAFVSYVYVGLNKRQEKISMSIPPEVLIQPLDFIEDFPNNLGDFCSFYEKDMCYPSLGMLLMMEENVSKQEKTHIIKSINADMNKNKDRKQQFNDSLFCFTQNIDWEKIEDLNITLSNSFFKIFCSVAEYKIDVVNTGLVSTNVLMSRNFGKKSEEYINALKKAVYDTITQENTSDCFHLLLLNNFFVSKPTLEKVLEKNQFDGSLGLSCFESAICGLDTDQTSIYFDILCRKDSFYSVSSTNLRKIQSNIEMVIDNYKEICEASTKIFFGNFFTRREIAQQDFRSIIEENSKSLEYNFLSPERQTNFLVELLRRNDLESIEKKKIFIEQLIIKHNLGLVQEKTNNKKKNRIAL